MKDQKNYKFKKMNITYFQPKNINPKYCERGTITENDPESTDGNTAD